MKLEEIKSVITQRLKEIKKMSLEYSEASDYDNLQGIIKKTIVAVAEAEHASDIESLAVYLEAIEDSYNGCRAEITGEASEEQLFCFDFELDEETSEVDTAPNPDVEIDDCVPKNIKTRIVEIEDYYDRTVDRCSFFTKFKLKSLRKKSIEAVNSARSDLELLDATRTYRREFKQFTDKLNRADAYSSAKKQYDEKTAGSNGKRANMLRIFVGFFALIGGAVYGFVVGWTNFPVWAISIMGFGISYLLIAMLYLATESRRGPKTKRRVAFSRIVLAVLFFIASIIAGAVLEPFGILPMLLATLPFTAGGVCVYGFYRLRLFFMTNKIAGK